ncbi:MAG: hypothetical protein ACKOTE_13575 [Opitutaceae bacterium]
MKTRSESEISSSFAEATEDETEDKLADAATAWSAASSRGYTKPDYPCSSVFIRG